MTYSWTLVFGGIVLFLLYKWFSKPKEPYRKDKGIPYRENNNSSIYTIFQLLTKRKTVIQLQQQDYDEFKFKKLGGILDFGRPSVIVTDLDLVKRILIKDFDHFVDRQAKKYQHDPYFDKMLVSLHGQEWKEVRSQLTPTFTVGKIKRMFQHFNKSGHQLVSYINQEQGKGGGDGLLIHDAVTRFIVDVIGAAAFGMDTKALTDKDSIFLKMARKVMDLCTTMVLKSLLFLNFPKLANFLRVEITPKDAMTFLTSILAQALNERKNGVWEKRDDFLQLIVEAGKTKGSGSEQSSSSDEDFEVLGEANSSENSMEDTVEKSSTVMSDEVVMAQCLMFFLAGVDTTSSLIGFALYLMAIHQDIHDKVREEIGNVSGGLIGERQETVDYDTVAKLEYLSMFTDEIQRMYPIASNLKRLCVQDYLIPELNFVIKKGTTVTIPVQGIHHDERYYPHPDRFEPERFSKENSSCRPQCAYLPFGHGQRNCIGMRFALIESKVALFHIVKNFKIEPANDTPIPIKIDTKIGVNRPVANLRLKFIPI